MGIHKYGKRHVVFVSFAFTLLGAQCLLYANVKVPWMFLIPESIHGLSRGLFWIGIHALIEYLSNAESERKIKQLLSGCHLPLGSAVGAVVGGAVYFAAGANLLFYGTSGLCFLLLLFVPLVDRCSPLTTKTQYSVILLDDDEFQPLKKKSSFMASEDSDSDEEEDWYSRAEKEADKELDKRNTLAKTKRTVGNKRLYKAFNSNERRNE